MKIVVQRVSQAEVKVDSKTVGKIGQGYMLLIGVQEDDDENDAEWLAKKILNLRIFGDEAGKMNLNIIDLSGEILCVSQFTLIADYRKGNRPGFTGAAAPEKATALFEYLKKILAESGLKIESGIFGADMKVSLINDGPVTIIMDSKTKS